MQEGEGTITNVLDEVRQDGMTSSTQNRRVGFRKLDSKSLGTRGKRVSGHRCRVGRYDNVRNL